jgi:hypothetical protein
MKIYDDMFDRNYKHILNSGFRFDPVLNHDYDPRRCLALYNIFNQQNTKFTPRFISVMDYLKQVLGPIFKCNFIFYIYQYLKTITHLNEYYYPDWRKWNAFS